MSPEETGQAYNSITHLWTSEEFNRSNGMNALEQALAYLPQLPKDAKALDVGCGCTCRFYPRLAEQGLSIEGIDVSSGMLAIAQKKLPRSHLHPRRYLYLSPQAKHLSLYNGLG